MNRNEIFEQIISKKSFLCVGLDSDYEKLSADLKKKENPQFEFNKKIIKQTHDLCVAYKLNLAFYEARGSQGMKEFEMTVEYLKSNYPNHLIIIDAKKGDIGNTANKQAIAYLDNVPGDAITVAPYMGRDSVDPFLAYDDKWVIILALTSNISSDDFQAIQDPEGLELYKQVIKTSKEWGTPDNTMYVVGATKPESFKAIRLLVPEHFFLVPGIGKQGGDLEKVCENGMNSKCGLLVNSSRGIIFSPSPREAARVEQQKMAKILKKAKLI